MTINRKCKYCGNIFQIYPYQKNTAKYCSRICCGKATRGKTISKKQREVLRKKNLGKTQSLETIQKRVDKLRGKKRSKEFCEHISKIRKGMKFTKKHRENLSKSHIGNKGELAGNWKGGITKINLILRESQFNKAWKLDILTRDKFTCRICGVKGGSLHVHHIKPFSKILKENKITSIEDGELCEELWMRDNGITLCIDCHKKIHFGDKNGKC
jgi:hypothetical protein